VEQLVDSIVIDTDHPVADDGDPDERMRLVEVKRMDTRAIPPKPPRSRPPFAP
jgi:hypothetical protein